MMAAPGEPGDQPIMYSIYFFMVVLLILICGNVGLLLFARAASREADLVVRTALGASRGRIVAQMFAEALVLGSVAAIVGVTAADFALRTWGTVFLETNMGRLPFWFDLSLSPRTFAVAIVLTVAGAAIAGIMPAMKITRGMGHRLKQTTAGSGGLQFGGVWTVVIVAQVAATVMFPAVVYMEQFLLRRVQDFDPGFATEQYLAVQIERDYPVDGGSNADAATLERNARLAATLEELRRRVAAQPGVAGVTFTEDLPTTNHPQKIIEMGYDLDLSDVSFSDQRAARTRSLPCARPPSRPSIRRTSRYWTRRFLPAAGSPPQTPSPVRAWRSSIKASSIRSCRAAMRLVSRCASATLGRPHGAGGRGTRTIPRDRVTGTK